MSPPSRVPDPPRSPRRVRGFTLLELMIVIVVLGILSAMIVPEMRGTYGDAVLRAGSRDLVDLCALASSRAVALQREHRLRLDPATRRYQLEKKTRSPAGSATFVPVRDLPGAHGELDPRLEARLEPTPPSPSDSSELSDSSDPSDPKDPSAPPRLPQILAFRPDGTADPVTIVLRDREGFGLALRINPITARIRVTALDRP